MRSIKDDGHPVALVTGGTSGIGRRTAILLAEREFRVVAVGLHADQYAETQSMGRCELVTLEMDVTDPDAIRRVIARLPRLDAIVHCAGFGIAGSAEATPMSLARRQFDVNYFGVLQVNQIALPLLRRTTARTRRRGRVVIVGSIGGRVGLPYQSHYSSTKAALETYTEALRLEGRRHGYTATIIEPGDLSTGFTASRVIAEPADSPYRTECQQSVNRMIYDETTGAGPDTVARAIVRTLTRRDPPVRTAVGATYKTLMILKRLLPDRLAERIMRHLYTTS